MIKLSFIFFTILTVLLSAPTLNTSPSKWLNLNTTFASGDPVVSRNPASVNSTSVTVVPKDQIEEQYFKLKLKSVISRSLETDKEFITELLKISSIDKIEGENLYIYSYSHRTTELDSWARNRGIETVRLTNPSKRIRPRMTNTLVTADKYKKQELGEWTAYPSYVAYEEFMKNKAQNYRPLCTLVELGNTNKKHKILALKITGPAGKNIDFGRPKVLFTGAIHGDELVGPMIMLQFIEYLLSNYEKDQRVKRLVDNLEIWINPIFNPDGVYAEGDTTVYGATRANGNYIDLNRNFPDPQTGEHADGHEWQPETIAAMNFFNQHNFVLGFEFHGGAELINYPWDTFERLHPDDEWFRSFSRRYVDTVHQNSTSDYMSDLNNGITNGYAWYEVNGGRQDFLNYFHHARTVTIELSHEKIVDATTLPTYFKSHLPALLSTLEQGLNGFKGQVIDRNSGKPLAAKVEILEHDKDNSYVESSATTGMFYRPILAGEYTLKISANGYKDEILSKVKLAAEEVKELTVQMSPSN